MNKLFFTFIFEKSFLLFTNKEEKIEKIILKLIGNFDKPIYKPILIKKDNLFISIINFKINENISYFISTTYEKEEKDLIYEIVLESYNKFISLYKNNVDLNEDLLNLINDQIINKVYLQINKKYKFEKNKLKEIKEDLNETKKITENNIFGFVEREYKLNEFEKNLENLNKSTLEFNKESNELKKKYFYDKWRIILVSIIFFFIISLLLLFFFNKVNCDN